MFNSQELVMGSGGYMTQEDEKNIEIVDIMRILPHAYPFLLIDRVIDFKSGEYATGIKNVSINEPYFMGHFSNNPVMPGVLIIEALAQLAAIVNVGEFCNGDKSKVIATNVQVGYLEQICNVKFYNVVIPGDQLILKVKKETDFLNISKFEVEGFVGERRTVKGKIIVTCKNGISMDG